MRALPRKRFARTPLSGDSRTEELGARVEQDHPTERAVVAAERGATPVL
jgi:hypothetical protein